MNVFEMHFVALKKKYSLEVSSESTEISIKRERVICICQALGKASDISLNKTDTLHAQSLNSGGMNNDDRLLLIDSYFIVIAISIKFINTL